MEQVQGDETDALVAAYRRGRLPRAAFVRNVTRVVRQYDIVTRTMEYAAIEAEIGEHICEFWDCPDDECEVA
jgi:hypothetical protein